MGIILGFDEVFFVKWDSPKMGYEWDIGHVYIYIFIWLHPIVKGGFHVKWEFQRRTIGELGGRGPHYIQGENGRLGTREG